MNDLTGQGLSQLLKLWAPKRQQIHSRSLRNVFLSHYEHSDGFTFQITVSSPARMHHDASLSVLPMAVRCFSVFVSLDLHSIAP